MFSYVLFYELSIIASGTNVANTAHRSKVRRKKLIWTLLPQRKSRDFFIIISWAHQNTAEVNYKPINHIDRPQMGRTLDPDCLTANVTAATVKITPGNLCDRLTGITITQVIITLLIKRSPLEKCVNRCSAINRRVGDKAEWPMPKFREVIAGISLIEGICGANSDPGNDS